MKREIESRAKYCVKNYSSTEDQRKAKMNLGKY